MPRDMIQYAQGVAMKAAALKRGERIVATSQELDTLDMLVDDIRSLPAQNVVAYCNAYYAQLAPFPVEMVRQLSVCAMK